MVPSQAVQDYLKAIYQLGGATRAVSTSEVASRLGVRPASASAMLRRLAVLGLATHSRYRGVSLTPAGIRDALEVIRHHRLLELYLARVVGLAWDEVHAEAEVLEHALSEALESRLDELLGHPTEDPHGDPIPGPDLVLREVSYPSLADLGPGEGGVVRRVSDSDPELLRHLARLGLGPGTRLTVTEVLPFGGGVRFRADGTDSHLGPLAARAVFVAREEEA